MMAKTDFEMSGIDLGALKNQMENQFMMSLLQKNPELTDQQRNQFRRALDVYEKHGIGAIETLDIIREISVIYNE